MSIGYQALLCGTSVWSFHKTFVKHPFASCSSLLMGSCGVLGILHFQQHCRTANLYQKVVYACEIVPLALMNTELYSVLGNRDIGMAHMITGALPLGIMMFKTEVNSELLGIVQLFNIISSIYLGLRKDNGWMIAMGLNQYFFRKSYHKMTEEVHLNIMALGLALFSFFAVKAIESAK